MAITEAMQTQITELYVGLIGRAPDVDGFSFWVNSLNDKIDGGLSETEAVGAVAQEMFDADATAAFYPGSLTNEQIVERFYENVLGREGDQEGIDFWTAALDGDQTTGEVLASMIDAVKNYDGDDADALTSKALFNNKVEVSDFYVNEISQSGKADIAGSMALLEDVEADTDTSSTAAIQTFVESTSGQDFTLDASADSVEEGDSVTFTLDTENVSAGESFSYTISGDVSADDIEGSLSGQLTVDSNGQDALTVNTVDDSLAESDETLSLSLTGEDASASVTVNDNDTTPSASDVRQLSTGQDSVSTGDGDDLIQGTRSDQNTENTFNAGDSIGGGAGFDTLEIELSGSDYDGNIPIEGIDRLNVETTDNEARSYSAENQFNEESDNLQQLWVENISKRNGGGESDQSGQITVLDLAPDDTTADDNGVFTLGVRDSGANVTGSPVGEDITGDAAAEVTFAFAGDKLTGSNDTVGLALGEIGANDDVGAQNVLVNFAVGDASNGIETLNVTSAETTSDKFDNSLNGLFDADGNAATMNVSGNGGLKARLAGNFTRFDAGGDTSNPAGGPQNITFVNAATMTVLGGSAGDVFNILNGPDEGGAHDIDTYEGDDEVTVQGNAGSLNDRVTLGEGDDTFQGDAGDYVISAGNGDDILYLGNGDSGRPAFAGDHNVTTGAGDDQVWLGSGDSSVSTDGGDDIVKGAGGQGSDYTVVTGDGEDTIELGVGDHNVFTGAGSDNVTAGDGDHNVTTGAGDDQVSLGDGNHTVDTGADADSVVVGEGDSTIETDGGNDSISIEDGTSKVFAGGGQDTIDTTGDIESDDILDGGAGTNDELVINGGERSLGFTEGGAINNIETISVNVANYAMTVSSQLVAQSNASAANGASALVVNLNGGGTVDTTGGSGLPAGIFGGNLTINNQDDTTVIADGTFGSNVTLNLGNDTDEYDVLKLIDGGDYEATDFANTNGVDEIFLDSAGKGDWTIEPTQNMVDTAGGTLNIRIDDDLDMSDRSLRIDTSELSADDTTQINLIHNSIVTDGRDIDYIDEDGDVTQSAPSFVNVVFGLELTGQTDTLDGGGDDLITPNDDTIIANDGTADFNNSDKIDAQGQNLYDFQSGGDTLQIQDSPDFLDGNGVAFEGESVGSDESNTGFLSQIWGHDAEPDDGSATVTGIERIDLRAGNSDVSFVDDVTVDDVDVSAIQSGNTYANDNGNISDTGHVVFETSAGDDYIYTADFNSTNTGAGDDTVELFGDFGYTPNEDRVNPKDQPTSGGEDVFTLPFRQHETGQGNDRVIMNAATLYGAQAEITTLDLGEGYDTVELRSWDAVYSDGVEQDDDTTGNTGSVYVSAGAFADDSGLNEIEYAANDVTPSTSFIELGDADLSAFEQVGGANTAIIRPAVDNEDKLVVDADGLTGSNRIDVIGTAQNDEIQTGDGEDKILTGNGADIVEGGAGDDEINTAGTDGANDLIDSGAGDDDVQAGDGDNEIIGGTGADDISAGGGADVIDAGAGDDNVRAGGGANDVDLGAGNDFVQSGDGDDEILGGLGNDTINAGDGANDISAGEGNDEVNTGSGDDQVFLGEGSDTEGNDSASVGAGADQVYGSLGADEIDLGDDNDVDEVSYANENEGALRGTVGGQDVITNFVSGDDKVVFYEPMVSELNDNGGTPIAIDWSGNNELDMRTTGNGGEANEGIVFDNNQLDDDQITELSDVLEAFNTSNDVISGTGDEALIVVHGDDDTALYHFRSEGQNSVSEGSTPNAGNFDTTVEANELALLGEFEGALLQESDFEFNDSPLTFPGALDSPQVDANDGPFRDSGDLGLIGLDSSAVNDQISADLI